MKYPGLFFSCLIFLFACSADPKNPSGENVITTVPADTADDNDNRFAGEVVLYRDRLKSRIQELEKDLDEKRKARKSERDKNKWKEQDTIIVDREQLRKDFQLRLDELEKQTATGWQNFKSEMEELFKRDREKDTIKVIHLK